ncbi:MAG TPA: hypothetical protein ENJ28_10495 [Gammaproteobacteria bacterium]|nr:hypothetical protein [Gammaproteobacteria bacterium]
MRMKIVILTILSSVLSIGLIAQLQAADASFESSHFSGSGNCSQCHDGLSDAKGKDISIVKNWSTSMMANSTRDPYWRAKVASELHRNPSVSAEINDKCSRCHAPMANETMKKEGVEVSIFGEGFLNTRNRYHDAAIDGVSCTACHQIADDGNLGTLEGFSGNYTILSYSNKVDRPAYGQYANPMRRPMQNNVQFTPQHGAHTSTSEMCATCHNVKTPFVDATGKIVSTTLESEFPEQMPYSEWNHSDFRVGGLKEKSCQACHMPKVEGNVKIATRPMRLDARPDFAKHGFLGANSMMMDILNSNRSELDISATGFDQSIVDTRKLLESSATLEIVSKQIIDNKLKVTLKINNTAGHKLPTSYPSRRAFIHFLVSDDQGTTVFESGKLNSNGSIVGVASDNNSSHYEPHYDQITQEDQVQVYESIMQNTDGAVTHTLLRASAYLKDNRLLPVGFDKATAPNDIAVKGAALNDTNFTQGSDTITYLVDIGQQSHFTIQAELNYQTIAYGHIQDMFKEADTVPEVATFKRYFENANIRSETLASVTSSIDTSNYTDYFYLKINNPLTIDVSVHYQTKNGTAIAGIDYVETNGTAIIPAGERSTAIGVDILVAGTGKTFSLVVSNPIGGYFPAGVDEISAEHIISNAKKVKANTIIEMEMNESNSTSTRKEGGTMTLWFLLLGLLFILKKRGKETTLRRFSSISPYLTR